MSCSAIYNFILNHKDCFEEKLFHDRLGDVCFNLFMDNLEGFDKKTVNKKKTELQYDVLKLLTQCKSEREVYLAGEVHYALTELEYIHIKGIGSSIYDAWLNPDTSNDIVERNLICALKECETVEELEIMERMIQIITDGSDLEQISNMCKIKKAV